ncbi:MAG TPA: hypothetical protein VN364_10735 [Bellilinea sp.]|nr:hypothetical protein [Bellilinea sp.]
MADDLRLYSRQTIQRLIAGGLMLLIGVGGILIYWIYGIGAAFLGVLCIFIGLLPIGLILLILGIMEWIVERNREQ